MISVTLLQSIDVPRINQVKQQGLYKNLRISALHKENGDHKVTNWLGLKMFSGHGNV